MLVIYNSELFGESRGDPKRKDKDNARVLLNFFYFKFYSATLRFSRIYMLLVTIF